MDILAPLLAGSAVAAPSSLRLATDAYYWKPMAAYFRTLELRVYRKAGIHALAPILDVGCGDGLMFRMLERQGIVDGSSVGIDIDARDLRTANGVNAHDALSRADGTRLPFADGSFATVFCNGTLAAIPDLDGALAELRRVLRPGGLLVATVPTDRFPANLPVAKLLGQVHPALRARYLRKLADRLPHRNELSVDAWCERLSVAAFDTDVRLPFFSRRESGVWNVLSLNACRVIGVLSLPGLSALAPIWRAGARALVSTLGYERSTRSEEAAYVLLTARRSAVLATTSAPYARAATGTAQPEPIVA